MSVGYSFIQWNRQKRVYDSVLVVLILLYVSTYAFVTWLMFDREHALSDEILIIRALGSCAWLMLHIVLCIGPLARLDRRFLILLYNRRHLGVATFLVALAHGVLVAGYYHGFGVVNPLTSLVTTNLNFTSLRAFPFQLFGLAALAILFLMAATSHDFWNRNLGPTLWKALHMLVYLAYLLVILHVAFGALQTDRGALFLIFMVLGPVAVAVLHLTSGTREYRADRRPTRVELSPWVDVCGVDEIQDQCGKAVSISGGERVAVYRHDNQISVLTNVCAHQGGPLGEGRIIDGCVTCPWHGWQYRPGDGQSPPPFHEKITTYRVRVENHRVFVDPRPLPPGTSVAPVVIVEATHE